MVRERKILILGLGEIGYNNAEYMAGIGIKADGFDLSQKAVNRALNSGVINGEAESFSGYDVYMICISTHDPGDMFQPRLEGLFDLAKLLADDGKRGALIAIESTISMGASQIVKDIVDHKLHVSHVPHRYYALDKEIHGVRQLRVLGGCEGCCAAEAMCFYGDTLGIPVYPVKAIEYAELTKVVENTERFLRISFAEELKMFCEGYGLDFQELRGAVNTKWNSEIFEARQGIGGHCLPKDSQMYIELAKRIMHRSVLTEAKKIDDDYRKYLVEGKVSLRPAAKVSTAAGLVKLSELSESDSR